MKGIQVSRQVDILIIQITQNIKGFNTFHRFDKLTELFFCQRSILFFQSGLQLLSHDDSLFAVLQNNMLVDGMQTLVCM